MAKRSVNSSKDAFAKLEGLGKGMINEINSGETPTFSASLRSKGNVFYDEKSIF